MRRGLALVLVSAGALTGCASFTPNQVAQPGNITFGDALTDVVKAFNKAELAESGKKMGVYVCMVTVNFNVAASASQGGKLLLDATIKAPAPANAGLAGSAEQDFGSSASRGNTISMVLTSPMCLPPNTSGTVMAAHVGNPAPVKTSLTKPGQNSNAGGSGNANGGGVALSPPDWRRGFGGQIPLEVPGLPK